MVIPQDWLVALAGGALIGLGATVLLAFNGRVMGVSGILSGLVTPKAGDISWRALFLVGLLIAGMIAEVAIPSAFGASAAPIALIGAAGLLVGFGTRIGNGCTSGHGVCGVARTSPRSIAATLTFLATGALTTLLVHGGAR